MSGLLTNKNAFFDYLVFQSHHYFEDTVPTNINGVKTSVPKQRITYRDGVTGTPKTSRTILDSEIEISWKVIPPNKLFRIFDSLYKLS